VGSGAIAGARGRDLHGRWQAAGSTTAGSQCKRLHRQA
jgi:hypothetical protein